MATRKRQSGNSDDSAKPNAAKRGKRVQVSKRIRFEVFKRDKFTCQYCGRKAPDVVLHIEHVEAVSRGGTNDIINLVAACVACNIGKSNIPLDDHSAVAKQRAQLTELQQRREQLQMMVEWRRGLSEIREEAIEEVSNFWGQLVPGYSVTKNGQQILRRALQKYSVAELIEAMEASTAKHIELKDGKPMADSASRAFDAITNFASVQRLKRDNPEKAKLLYIRGIMRKRFSYCPDDIALHRLEDAVAVGVSTDDLSQLAKRERTWTGWEAGLERLIEGAEARASKTAEASPAPVVHALLEELERLGELGIWQVVGYAKGLAIASDARAYAEGADDDHLFRVLDLENQAEAQGLVDALGVAQSTTHVDRLLEMGGLDTDQVLDIMSNGHPDLPMAPTLIYDERGSRVAVERLPPLTEISAGGDSGGSGHENEPVR